MFKSIYSEKWMELILEDVKKRLDGRRFKNDQPRPVMWDSLDLGLPPEPGEPAAPPMFIPGFIVTVVSFDRTIVYHTDNKGHFRVASDVTEDEDS